MNIRMYRSEDCKEIVELFYNTVHSVNSKDYNKAQLDACLLYTSPSPRDRHNLMLGLLKILIFPNGINLF